MTQAGENDRQVEALSRMPVLTPDSARAEDLRVRCHARLARQRRGTAMTVEVAGFGRGMLAPAIVWGFCALYVGALVEVVVTFFVRRT